MTSAAFVYVPATTPAAGICFAGEACVDRVSLSCLVFEFGAYTNFYGSVFFTYHCS